MVSKYLSVTKFDPNYLRTGRTEWAEIFWGEKSLQLLAARAVFESLFFLQKQLIYGFIFEHKKATQTCTIRRGYEICNTNFTST